MNPSIQEWCNFASTVKLTFYHKKGFNYDRNEKQGDSPLLGKWCWMECRLHCSDMAQCHNFPSAEGEDRNKSSRKQTEWKQLFVLSQKGKQRSIHCFGTQGEQMHGGGTGWPCTKFTRRNKIYQEGKNGRQEYHPIQRIQKLQRNLTVANLCRTGKLF